MCLSMRHFTETTFGWPLKGPGPEHLEERDLLLSSSGEKICASVAAGEALLCPEETKRERGCCTEAEKPHITK